MKRDVSPAIVRAVIDRLQKNGIGNRLNFLAALSSHGPPLASYAAEVVKYRADLALGKDGIRKVSDQMEEMIRDGFNRDLLISLNKEIVAAVLSAVDASTGRQTVKHYRS